MSLAEELARRSEEDLRALMERNPDVMVVVAEGRIVACNPAMVELSSRSMDQILGTSPLDLLHPDDRESAQDRMRAVLSGDRLQGAVYRGVNADGEVIYLEIRTVPITFRDGSALLATIRDVTEQRRSEEALRLSERRLRESQRITHVGSWGWEVEADEAWWSDEVYRIFGIEPEGFEVTYESYMACVHPDDRAAVADALDRALREGSPFDMDLRIVRLDGSVRILHERGEVERDESGQAIRMLGTVQDVTEQKAAESLLRESEENLRALTEGIADGVAVVVDGKILLCNSAMADLVGSTVEQLLGTEVIDYLHPDDRERAAERIRDIFAGGPVGVAEYRMVRADGEVFPMAVSSAVIRYAGKKALASTIRDVTEQKRRQEALRLSERRLRESQRITHVGSWGWDVKADEAWWSDEVYRIFGIDPEGFEVTYESYMARVHPDDQAAVAVALGQALREGAPFDMDLRIVRPDGSVRILHERGEVERDESGQAIRMLGTVQDVTEAKMAEEAIRRAEEQARKSSEQLRALSIHLEQVREQERSDVAREIHDEVGQAMTALQMDLAWLRRHDPQARSHQGAPGRDDGPYRKCHRRRPPDRNAPEAGHSGRSRAARGRGLGGAGLRRPVGARVRSAVD